jgi:hypothetical protein
MSFKKTSGEVNVIFPYLNDVVIVLQYSGFMASFRRHKLRITKVRIIYFCIKTTCLTKYSKRTPICPYTYIGRNC